MVLVAIGALILSLGLLSYHLPPSLWPRAVRSFLTAVVHGGGLSGGSGTGYTAVRISRHPDAPPVLVTLANRTAKRQQLQNTSLKSNTNGSSNTTGREGTVHGQTQPRSLNSLNRNTPAPGVQILRMRDIGEVEADGDATPKATPAAPTFTLDVPTLSLGSEEEADEGPQGTSEQKDAAGESVKNNTTLTMPPPPSKPSASSLMPPPSIRPSSLKPLPRANIPSVSPLRGPLDNKATNATPSALRNPPSGISRPLAAPNNLAASARGPPSSSSLNPSSSASSSTLAPAARPSKKVILAPGHSPLDWASLCRKPPSATFLRGADVPPNRLVKVSPTQLRHYNGRKGRDAWGTYQGKVYNLTPYRDFHPGGPGELYRGAGRAGETERLFKEVHPWVNWDAMLSECMVGVLVGEGEGEGESGGSVAGVKNGGLDLEAVD